MKAITIAIVLLSISGATRSEPGLVAAGDPAVPASLRGQARRSPTGAALDALVEQKLRRHFEAADTSGSGHITRAQAAAAGWGAVAQRFDQIDARGAGEVSFDDVRSYLRANARR